MPDDCICLNDEAVETIIADFTAWLYDECPVSPDEVTRQKLLSIWDQWYHEYTMPTREEILPHTRTAAPDFKDKLIQIVR